MTPRTASQLRQDGIAAAASGNHPAAAGAFSRALEILPGDPELLSRLALAKLSMGDLVAARNLARQGAAHPKAEATALDRLGHVLCRLREFAEGLALFRRAVAAEPRNVAFQRNLAWGAQYVGDLDTAEGALRAALRLAPEDAMAWSTLTALPGWRSTDEDLAALRRLAARRRSVPEDLAAAHALSRALEARGEQAEALSTLSGPKRARLAQKPYRVADDLAVFRAAADLLDLPPSREGARSDAPIFVVGPPRSGTTLMDRILSSHPQVVSAGELGVMFSLVRDTAGEPPAGPLTPAVLARAGRGDPAVMGRRYLEAAKVVVGEARRFTDKRPFNLILAGLIHRILPDARIVRMRRNPADTVLGNYRQFFNLASPHHGFSYDLADAARYVDGLESLSELWEARLPADRYRVVDYERLVSDPEGEIAAVLEFCGLPWDPACLAFHENDQGVSTASAAQVREPLHDRNVGMWRRYGRALEPALSVLRAAGRLAE